jgi:hypothetical protein
MGKGSGGAGWMDAASAGLAALAGYGVASRKFPKGSVPINRSMPYKMRKTRGMYRRWRRRSRRPGAFTRKRRFKKRRYKRKSRVWREINKIKKDVESGMGTFQKKVRVESRVLSGVNAVNHSFSAAVNITGIEGAIDNLPVFNPSLPGTYTFVDFKSGTQKKEVLIKAHSKFLVKNNYNSPAKVSIYLVFPKNDTSITPTTAMTAGLNDISGNPATLTITSPMIYPNHSPQFRDLWSIKKQQTKVLEAGQVMSMSNTTPQFQYDPSFADDHNLQYQRRYMCHGYLVRVEGVLGHDTSADERGILQAGIDCSNQITYTVRYEAGADIEYLEVDDTFDTFTGAGVVAVSSDRVKEQYAVN